MIRKHTSVFADRGFSFDEITLNGALGGPDALQSYLATRRSQLTRRLSLGDEEARDRIVLSISAIKDAELLIAKLYQSGLTKPSSVS